MFKRYGFLIIFSILLSSLGWWSGRVESSKASLPVAQTVSAAGESPLAEGSKRRELLEVLDRVVVYEHYYRSVYGHFTKFLNRVGFPVPAHVATNYDIHIAEASTEKLLVTAFSEVQGRMVDIVSIDHNFQTNANFTLPPPRAEYLKVQALKQLRALREAPAGQMGEEQGIYRNYFRFEVRKDSADRKIAFAVGLRPPVVGMQLEVGPGNDGGPVAEGDSALRSLAELAEIPSLASEGVGQSQVEGVLDSSDQSNLAQRIFHGEMGRFAKTWSELSMIARFQSNEGGVDGVTDEAIHDKNSQKISRRLSSTPSSLEIEPISSDE